MEEYRIESENFKTAQYRFTAHLRDPETCPAPSGVEDRRMAIYRDLIYKNIEGFIRGAFPVLRRITPDDRWHAMVRDFVKRHQSHSPYFLEISEEFLKYLQEERGVRVGDPPFMLELAHYEWVELALDVSTETFPAHKIPSDNLLESIPVVSPLAWCLSYQYPVHLIGPDYQPCEPPEAATFLIVYRTRDDKVAFMHSNAVTVRLLNLLEQEAGLTGREALLRLAAEMQHPQPESLLKSGFELLHKLQDCHVIGGV